MQDYVYVIPRGIRKINTNMIITAMVMMVPDENDNKIDDADGTGDEMAAQA